MSGPKAPHHQGTYHVAARMVRLAAYANPDTKCWRCGRTIQAIRSEKPHAKWTAGHLVDGQAGGPMAPECSPCNYGAGARIRNRKRTDLSW